MVVQSVGEAEKLLDLVHDRCRLSPENLTVQHQDLRIIVIHTITYDVPRLKLTVKIHLVVCVSSRTSVYSYLAGMVVIKPPLKVCGKQAGHETAIL